MAKVKLPSGRIVKVPDGMSQEETIDFLIDRLDGNDEYDDDRTQLLHRKHPEKSYDWISDVTGTIGSVIGGVGGAVAGGVFGGGIGAVPGAVGGSTAGGAAGGALGEYIEGLLDPRERQGSDIASTAIQEGAFGLIPGVGGAATKGGLRAGHKVLSKIPVVGKLLPSTEVTKQFAKLNIEQKKLIIDPLIQEFVQNLPKGAKLKPGELSKLSSVFYGNAKNIDDYFKQFAGKPKFEKAVNAFYNKLVARGVLVGGAATATGCSELLAQNEKNFWNDQSA